MTEIPVPFESELKQFTDVCSRVAPIGLGSTARLIAVLAMTKCLDHVAEHPDDDPYPAIKQTLGDQTRFLSSVATLMQDVEGDSAPQDEGEDLVASTKRLFEEAWTVYSESTYRHSVELIERRLSRNGYDRAFFEGKRCFDGGCGTGRFSVAMARLGAAEVVGADIGTESLGFAMKMAKTLGAPKISFVQTDVTNLSQWKDEYFDYVVSNGVLHHAIETERGILEHFRVLKRGGTMWLYLYGAGGFYWNTYDRLSKLIAPIPVPEVRRIFLELKIRKGLIYTFLDNVLAPIRKYYSLDDTFAILSRGGKYSHTILRGVGASDDYETVMASQYGREIIGPDGEIRLAITKL